jgi:hypothetical protein
MKASYSATLIGLLGVLLCAGFFTYLSVQNQAPAPVSPISTERFGTQITYVSPVTNETVDLEYTEGAAFLQGVGFDGVKLALVSSADGARYENKKENVILQPKANDITLYQGRREIFFGTDANTVAAGTPPPVNIPDPDTAEATTTTAATTTVAQEETVATTSDAEIE